MQRQVRGWQRSPLPTVFRCQAVANPSSEESDVIIKFNTPYSIVKEELPFANFKSQIILANKKEVVKCTKHFAAPLFLFGAIYIMFKNC